jgi:hypothetical protein
VAEAIDAAAEKYPVFPRQAGTRGSRKSSGCRGYGEGICLPSRAGGGAIEHDQPSLRVSFGAEEVEAIRVWYLERDDIGSARLFSVQAYVGIRRRDTLARTGPISAQARLRSESPMSCR